MTANMMVRTLCCWVLISSAVACPSPTPSASRGPEPCAAPGSEQAEASTSPADWKAEDAELAKKEILTGDFDAAAAAIERLRGASPSDGARIRAVALLAATLEVYRGDLDAAIAELRAALPRLVALGDHFWLWDVYLNLGMVFEMRGEIDRAIAARDAALVAGQQAARADRDLAPSRVYLPDAWHRALNYRLLAETRHGARKRAALAFAEASRAEYRELAAADGGHADSIAVLDVIFAVHDGDHAAARAAAARVDVDENGDMEDLYLTWLGFNYGGDASGAARVEKRMRKIRGAYVYIGMPERLLWLEYDVAAKASGKATRFTPRHPNAGPP